MTFSKELKEQRKKLGKTLYQCGELLDVSWVTVWRWEHEHVIPKKLTQIGVLQQLKEAEND